MAANRSKTKTSLAAVIVRMRSIANDHYHGKIYDNILAIFNQLSTIEKRVLLRGLIGICFIVENKILSEVESVREVRTTIEQTSQELGEKVESQLEVQNEKALISMKGWAFRLVFTILTTVLVLAIIGSWLVTGKFEFLEKYKDVFEFLKMIFGGSE